MNPTVCVALCNEKNKNKREFNLLLDANLGNDVELFDFFADLEQKYLVDGLHLNDDGKQKLSSELQDFFEFNLSSAET